MADTALNVAPALVASIASGTDVTVASAPASANQPVMLGRVSEEVTGSKAATNGGAQDAHVTAATHIQRMTLQNDILRRDLEQAAAEINALHEQRLAKQADDAASVVSNGSDVQSVVLSEYKNGRRSRRSPRPMGRMTQEVTRRPPAGVHQTLSSTQNNNSLVTFREICDILNQNYNYEEAIKSTTLDIISVYLKGQKVLYIEAKTYCEQQLYALMLPTIAITAICSVISVVLKELAWGAILVSCLSATNTFVLSLITYLKLDAKAEAHKTSAYSYESLQSSCEFSSGKILLQGLADVSDDLTATEEEKRAAQKSHADIMNMIEVRVKEIKDSNKFVLPEVIRYKFPKVYSTNVFTEVKRLQNQEIILINRLKIVVNKIRQLENERDQVRPLVYKQQIDDLNVEQDTALDAIINYRNTYLDIDKAFRKEIDDNIALVRRRCGLCRWLKT
jgi:hypothetical protein